MANRETRLRIQNGANELEYLRSLLKAKQAGTGQSAAGLFISPDVTTDDEPETPYNDYGYSCLDPADHKDVPIESLCWVKDRYELLPEPHDERREPSPV